ncbi:hypothetical protein [Thalassomonas actiniarum]|uniref:Uncharacterized protein n=1 Tax=Thalassomonas actiniarum TaxID=485447 RepID=A0AAF0C4Q9_9GAMM|nr:hypothetical protein [Thalassomonas actiniarum]WDE00748.1 hypothetical protein SG35_009005 [Thalassomonas actiniarum]
MLEFTLEVWLMSIGGISFLLWGIGILCFGRITVRHIEREMGKEGKEPPVWDKGIGGRFGAYALIILFPNIKRHASLVDVVATKRYARKIDWYLALFLQITFAVFIVAAGIAYYLYGPE